jgi:flagellar motility protein MotE (MotC chaperone)
LGTLANIIKSEIQEDTLKSKDDLILLENMLGTLYKKRDFMKNLEKEAKENSANLGKRRVKFLFYLIGAQMAFTQYGTYVKYSWDILEPICCLFSIFDMIVAYSFWLRKNHEFDYQAFEQRYLEEKVSFELGRQIGFQEEMGDIEKMIQHLEVWKYMQSDDLADIIEALDEKFQKIK